MPKYAFWIDGNRGPELRIIYDRSYNEYELKHGVAPAAEINALYEDLSIDDLKQFYPCPESAPMPKNKRQD
jgi:hypothetical protein